MKRMLTNLDVTFFIPAFLYICIKRYETYQTKASLTHFKYADKFDSNEIKTQSFLQIFMSGIIFVSDVEKYIKFFSLLGDSMQLKKYPGETLIL